MVGQMFPNFWYNFHNFFGRCSDSYAVPTGSVAYRPCSSEKNSFPGFFEKVTMKNLASSSTLGHYQTTMTRKVEKEMCQGNCRKQHYFTIHRLHRTVPNKTISHHVLFDKYFNRGDTWTLFINGESPIKMDLFLWKRNPSLLEILH